MFLIARALRKFHPVKILFLSLACALLAGYISDFNHTLASSRIIVFFPIFFLGYVFDKNKILSFVNKPTVRVLSVIVILGFIASVFLLGDRVSGARKLFTACSPYNKLDDNIYLIGPILRFGAYCISAVMSIAILSIIPNRRIPLFTYCGTKSPADICTTQTNCSHISRLGTSFIYERTKLLGNSSCCFGYVCSSFSRPYAKTI